LESPKMLLKGMSYTELEVCIWAPLIFFFLDC
jgi:hypothetical protein